MKGDPFPYQLHLFTLRLWREKLDPNVWEWRGEVKNVSTGEVRYFRNPRSLYDTLLVLLGAPSEETDEEGRPAGPGAEEE